MGWQLLLKPACLAPINPNRLASVMMDKRDRFKISDAQQDMIAAAMILTRLPVPFSHATMPDTARSYWCFPLIGVVVAVLPVLLGVMLASAHLPLLGVAALMLGGIALLTGGLHHDGLADLADSLGGRDPAHRLTIMRDSSIGSFGTLALITIVIVDVAAIAALGNQNLTMMASAMIAVAALSRSMMGLQRWLHPTPDEKGLAAMTGRPSAIIMLIGMAIGLLMGLLFLPFHAAVSAMAIGLIVTGLLGRFMMRWIGGVNGDGLGATQQLSEAAMLMTLAVVLTPAQA